MHSLCLSLAVATRSESVMHCLSCSTCLDLHYSCRACPDKNTPSVQPETPIKFVDGLKRHCTSNKVTDEEIRVLWEKWTNDDAWKAEEQRQKTLAKAKATAKAQSVDEEVLFAWVLSCMTDCRFGSLHGYLHHLMTTKAQHVLYQALKLLINEGNSLLNNM